MTAVLKDVMFWSVEKGRGSGEGDEAIELYIWVLPNDMARQALVETHLLDRWQPDTSFRLPGAIPPGTWLVQGNILEAHGKIG